MKSIGIIAEYNPFHEGHEYLIKKAKEETGAEIAVSVISGDFVQRGAAAAFDKWERAEMAIRNGVNLVLEMPVVYAVNSAEYFAGGGVEILEGLGHIDYIAFGSESGEIGKLQAMAEFLKTRDKEINAAVQALMKKGCSYPRAREEALLTLENEFDSSLISDPNNILALEYLKHIKTLKPYTVKRMGKGYHPSATEIRGRLVRENPQKFNTMDKAYWHLAASKILQTPSKRLEEIFGAGEGLGNKLKKEIRYASSAEELAKRMKSKAYTHTRIERLITQVILDIDEEAVHSARSYIRVLGFDGQGAGFLKEVKKRECAKLPIITNINKEAGKYPEIQKTLEKDILAADLYNLICGKDLYANSDYVKRPYVK